MQIATAPIGADHRRPAGLDFAAALFLLATVVLHVVAMFPVYTDQLGSLASQTDQAASYAVLAAGWALALIIGLLGPHRTPVAAGLAVGVALTELGFRGTDLGQAFHDGTGTASTGLWLMEVAWVVGAVGAVLAVLAARSRHSRKAVPASVPGPGPSADADAEFNAELNAGAPVEEPSPYDPGPDQSPTLVVPTAGAEDPTAAVPAAGDTSILQMVLDQPPPAPAAPAPDAEKDDDAHERWVWTVLVVVLAAVVAGAFLPPWDHETILFETSGRAVSQNEGNAFAQPWEMIVGTVAVSAIVLLLASVAVRLRDKAVGAAVVVGSMIVMASQLVSAVALAASPSASDFGVTPAQIQEYGLNLSLKLTGWFTLDALAIYALFAAVMVWANLREVQANSPGAGPMAPERRSSEIPSGV